MTDSVRIAADPPFGTATVAAPAPDHGRVLIVDDNEINRRVLTAMLRREHYILLSAGDGERALALALAEPPDLILLDIMMPGRDGYAVCAALKDDPRTANVPVIFLSALAEAADKIKGLELGAVDYITKPFDQGEVLARVRSQLKIQRLADELRRVNRDLGDKQARIGEDLRAAVAIQRSLVPAAPPPIASLRTAWRFMPCDKVGGDLFNFWPLGDDHLGVYMIDVSGHGVPAAMVTVSLSQFLSPQAGHLHGDGGAGALATPGQVLQLLDREYPIERFDKYFTIAYALIDHRRGRLRYALAGHPQPLLLRADGRVELLDAGGPLIGLGMEAVFEEAELALQPGDRLFLYTDGIVELESPSGELFGDARLCAHLRALADQPLDTVCDELIDALLRFAGGGAPQDDITLLAIELSDGADERPADVRCPDQTQRGTEVHAWR